MQNTITIKGKERQICTRCIYDETITGISFDEEGVCNYCRLFDKYKEEFGTGKPEGEEKLKEIIAEIKKDGKGKKYDCIIGVSGGTDSSYLVAKLVEWGLRPLAVHYDNTWNTAIATENIKRVLGKLNVDLYTYVVDNKEIDDIFMSFLKADVPELDASTDLALAEVMYRMAAKYHLKYIIEGHSFVTEGIAPLRNMYFDGKYIKSIHKQYGKLPMKTYPLMTFEHFMRWSLVKRVKRIRPLWYIDYNKAEAREFLTREFGWQYYGGHHLENRIVAIQHSWYNYHKFHLDNRILSLSAAVRNNLMSREKAIDEYYYKEPYAEEGLLDYFKNRLNLSDKDLEDIINRKPRYFTEFPTYKDRFYRLRWLFRVLANMELVPMSFYTKYCESK